MFGLGGHGGGVFSQNLHMYLSKYLPVFIKILTCIYQNPNLYFLKSVPVFLKICTRISQNLYLYFSKSLPVFLKIFTSISQNLYLYCYLFVIVIQSFRTKLHVDGGDW